MTRPSHPKKEIEAALKHAEDEGWWTSAPLTSSGAIRSGRI